MILKFLLVIGVIAFVYFIFIKKKPAVKQTKENPKNKDEVQSNDMVECEECGVYAEINDSILSNSKYYCSQECLKRS